MKGVKNRMMLSSYTSFKKWCGDLLGHVVKGLSYLLTSKRFWYQFLLLTLFFLTSIYFVWNGLAQSQEEIARLFPSFYAFLLLGLLGLFISESIDWRFIFPFLACYLFYLVTAYFIRMTLSLNDSGFHWDRFKNFFQSNFLGEAFLMIGLALSCHYIGKWMQRVRRSYSTRIPTLNTNVILAGLMSTVYLTGAEFLNRLETNHFMPVTKGTDQEILYAVVIYSLGFFCLYFFINLVLFHGLRLLRTNRASLSLAFASSVIIAVVDNYFIQAGITLKGKWYNYYIASGATIFQIVLLTLLFFFLFLVINRFLPAFVLNIFLAVVLAVVNQVKFALREEPFLPSDLIWLKDITFFKEYVSTDALSSFFLILVMISICLFFIRKKVLPNRLIPDLKKQFYFVLAFLLLVGSSSHLISQHDEGKFPKQVPVLSSLYNLYDINWLGINAKANYQSVAYVWFRNLTSEKMVRPEGYSHVRVREIYEKYQAIALEMNQERGQSISDQTVIYILSESLSNPLRLPDIVASGNPIPAITDIMTQYTGGEMQSDGYGGGTANMEFQSLTGLVMPYFDTGVSILYSEIFPTMLYVPTISDQFLEKNRIAIHLAGGGNYNRNLVYSKLQFDQFIAQSGTKDKAKDIIPFGVHASDHSTYQYILNSLDENENQFFSVITMQNHTPYVVEVDNGIAIAGKGFSDKRNQQLQTYANLLMETDRATKELLEQLQHYPKKVTVVFYGDHLPGIYPDDFFQANAESQYLTDYFIWSNDQPQKLDYPKIRANDFPALLLKETNSRLSPYYALLTQYLPDRNGERNQEVEEELKIIQYDLTVGRNYISHYPLFFEIGK